MKEKTLTEQEALQRMAARCSTAELCQHDMLSKLQQWGLDEAAIARIMQYLTEHRFVDEERYCRAFVNDKVRYAKWGRRKIEQALWQKHIDPQLVQQALDDVDDELYVEMLRPQIQAKRQHTTARNEYELNMKLIRWAMGRGYTIEIIRRCLDTDLEDV